MSQETSNSNKIKLYVLVGVLVVSSISFRLINDYNLEQTSILFVGLPALMTLLMVKYSKTPKSAYGVVFKVITIFLLMSSILLGEGSICVLFAAPIFYGVAALIVFIIEYLKKRNESKLLSVLLIPVLLVVAQPFGIKGEPEIQTEETCVVINKGVSIDSFNKKPDLLKNYPNFFKIGFPKPIGIQGTGTTIGDTRNIQFESSTKGIGTLSLEVIESNESSIIFKVINDNSHINHWLTWKKMKVEIIKISPNQTKIKWISQYQCDLGPSWYFEPLEEIAVEIMNKHLIDVYFN
jgi:hypothetical protein